MNLACRLAFGQLDSQVTSQFLIFDEVFVYGDKNMIDILPLLFDYVRKNYKWCMVITHDDKIKRYCDNEILIEKVNNYSHIDTGCKETKIKLIEEAPKKKIKDVVQVKKAVIRKK